MITKYFATIDAEPAFISVSVRVAMAGRAAKSVRLAVNATDGFLAARMKREQARETALSLLKAIKHVDAEGDQ